MKRNIHDSPCADQPRMNNFRVNKKDILVDEAQARYTQVCQGMFSMSSE